MALRNVDTPDNTPGSGFAPMLTRPSRTVEGATSLIQIIDQWHDVEDAVAYHIPPASVTLPVLSATLGYRPVLSIIVPSGKIFVPEFMASDAAGTLQARIRISRRFHFWAFSGATIAAPAAPTLAVNANSNSGFTSGSISYKLSALNNVGETTPSAASSTVTPTANDSVSLTLTPPAGARRIRIYRTLGGQGGTGPWFLLHELDAAQAGYRDVHPEGDLNQGVQPLGANQTSGSLQVETAPQPVPEVQAVVQDVALAASPSRMIYTDEDGLQEDVATTLTTTVNTQTRISLKRADLGLTGAFDAQARVRAAGVSGSVLPRGEVNNGATRVVHMVGNPATGQYNIYGILPVIYNTHLNNVAPVGGNNALVSPFYKSVVFPAGSECIVEMAHGQGTTAAAAARDLLLCGRMLTV